MDETGIALGVCSNDRVIGTSSTKSSFKKTPESREWVSIIEAISAFSKRLQALVIFKGKNLQTSWFSDESTPDYRYTTSENGWTSNEIGLAWLEQIFLPQTAINDDDSGEYRLLLLDGHKSHATFEFMWKCHENKVVVFYLPPHSSHVLQPLDLTCFSPVKGRYREQIANLARYDDASAVKKAKFLDCYQKASQEGLSEKNIKAGWRAAGLHPWNPHKAIHSSQVLQNAPITAQTPPNRKRRHSVDMVYRTPKSRRDIDDSIQAIQHQEPISRSVRNTLFKIGKGFDELQWELAQSRSQLALEKSKNKEKKAGRQEKKAINSNQAFASIETIKQAKEALAIAQAAKATTRAPRTSTTTRNESVNNPVDAYLHVFSINETPS